MKEIWISPSDLSYSWNESKLGFYDKYVLGIPRPRGEFPAIFTTISSKMKGAFEGKDLSETFLVAPSGKVTAKDMFVTSAPITLGDFEVSFRGKISTLVEEESGKVSIVDFKTIKYDEKLSETYFLHFMAYAFCLENPAVAKAETVNKMGIVTFDPTDFSIDHQASIEGNLNYVPIDLNKNKFKNWLLNDLKDFLNSNREDVFASSSDREYERYIDSFCEVD
jgi:hypothetical protein